MKHPDETPDGIIVRSAVAVVSLWLGIAGARGTDDPAAPSGVTTPPVPVQVVPLRFGRIRQTSTAYGVVQSRVQQAMAMTTRSDAVVTAVHLTQGEAVAADTSMFELSPTPEAQLLLKQAQDAQRAADKNVEQVRRRREDQLATNAEVAAAEQAQQTARTQLDAIESRGVGSTISIKSGAAGVLTQLNVQPGQTVVAGTVLAMVTPQNGLEAKIGVDPADVRFLAAGAAVDLRDVNQDAQPLPAKLRAVGHSIDPQSRRVDAFVTLPAEAALLSGAFVEAKFVTQTADGLLAPRDATREEDHQWTLYSVRDGKAVRHVIKIGLIKEDKVQVIADDLKADDTIITARNGELIDGISVTIEVPTTQPADGAKGGE